MVKDKAQVLLANAEAQTVTVTLVDGRTGSFVGPVVLTKKDGAVEHSLRVGVKSIHFSEPFLLKPGVFFVRRDDGNIAVAMQAPPRTGPLEDCAALGAPTGQTLESGVLSL